MNIKNAQFTNDHTPIDPGLDAYVSKTFTKAYLRHLQKSNEILGLQIASQQNLAFYCWLMREARQAILDDRFMAWKDAILPQITRRW
jgi:queuine tRNA-ribosyltransferase